MLGEMLLFFANYGIYFIVIISLINFRKEGKSLIALALSLAISYCISSIFYVPRPFVKENFMPFIAHAPDSSFPSHHASIGFALSFSTFNTNTILGLASSVIAVLMSVGRIYAGLHSNIDIIGGLFIGAFCAIFAYSKFTDKLLSRIAKKFKPKKRRK